MMWSKHNSKSKPKIHVKPAIHTNKKKISNASINDKVSGQASIFDLNPNDKTKIGNLIRKVVELDNKCKNSKQTAKTKENKLKKQVNSLKSQNNQIIKQHTKLRLKFKESIKLIQNYELKLKNLKINNNNNKNEKKQQLFIKEMYKEINDLKQLINKLHNKEKNENNNSNIINNNATRKSMIFVNQNENKKELLNIQSPQLQNNPPLPHPYPYKNKKNKLNLSQLRKYSISSSSSSSSSSSLNINSPEIIKHHTTSKYKNNVKIDKNRLNQLMKIQSGHFKKNTKNKNLNNVIHNSSSSGHLMYSDKNINRINNEKSKPNLRRVQSEKIVNTNFNVFNTDIHDFNQDIDRLSNYEGSNIMLSFPETDDEYSDREDEMLLIQHLNLKPNAEL